jgi:5,5'-dehydrodivanillate O-demethylase oxygenase subunit
MAIATTEQVGQETLAHEPDMVHTGPETLAGRYLRTFWHPVALARELAPGRAKPVKLMSEEFTLYRGESGEVHAVAFRCAHRGTQLSTGWVEGDNLRCFYHGWAYGPDGQCVEQPAEPEPFCNRIKIKSYPVEEYLGLIFVYQGEGEAPPLPRYPAFEREGLLTHSNYVRKSNFYNSVDNDPIHVFFTHRQVAPDWRQGLPTIMSREDEYGITHEDVFPDGRRKPGTYRLMPNISYRVDTHDPENTVRTKVDALAWRVPVDDETHTSFGVDLVHLTGDAAREYEERLHAREAKVTVPAEWLTDEVLAGRLDMNDIDWSTTSQFNVQDGVTQVGQGTYADRANEHLGRSDTSVILCRQIWARELRALAEGRPLTRWLTPID